MSANENVRRAGRIKIDTALANLKKRNFNGYYAEDRQEALKILLELIPEGSVVGKGGSQTLEQVGIIEALSKGNYNYIEVADDMTPEEKKAGRRACFSADFFLSSANAITMDGEIVNIDGNGNRVAALIWGPDKVIIVAGVNKLVASEKEAIGRIKQEACPPNCIRLGRKTPCSVTGVCGLCRNPSECICCHTVTTRLSPMDDRVNVILVNEELGY